MLVMNGDIGMNMEFDHEFSMMLDPSWDVDNIEGAAVVWKKEGDSYIFSNRLVTRDCATND